jgi:hypothetical protein
MGAKDCKHENADHLMPGDRLWTYLADEPETIVRYEQFRCIDCMAWLSLGPSNDDERACIELRAADIAWCDPYALSRNQRLSLGEGYGMMDQETIDLTVVERDGTKRIDKGVGLNLDHPDWQAGHLARCILKHGSLGWQGDEAEPAPDQQHPGCGRAVR